jgi:hypothetical protein
MTGPPCHSVLPSRRAPPRGTSLEPDCGSARASASVMDVKPMSAAQSTPAGSLPDARDDDDVRGRTGYLPSPGAVPLTMPSLLGCTAAEAGKAGSRGRVVRERRGQGGRMGRVVRERRPNVPNVRSSVACF